MKDLDANELAECADPGDGSCEHLITARMAAEIRRDRAMIGRLQEWADQLDEGVMHASGGGVGPSIAAELRSRMRGQ